MGAGYNRVHRSIEKLNAKGFKIKWGEDLGYDEEKALAEDFGKPFFIYAYPRKIKAFYCKTYRDDLTLLCQRICLFHA